LDRPYVEDARAVIDAVRSLGIGKIVLVGSCFGGRTALAAANEVEAVEGVALIATPIRDFAMGERTITRLATQLTFGDLARRAFKPRVLRRLLDREYRTKYRRVAVSKIRRSSSNGSTGSSGPDRWVSPTFIDQCECLLSREKRLLIVLGDGEDLWDEFERAQAGRLGKVLRERPDLVEIRSIPGQLHGFPNVRGQVLSADVLTDWLMRADRSVLATEPAGGGAEATVRR
jgi:pimeloyl-ACP methyl ester carboxylesterase